MLGGSNRQLTMRECAAYLNVPHSTLQRRWRTWGLPATRVGKALRFRERDIERWLETRKAA